MDMELLKFTVAIIILQCGEQVDNFSMSWNGCVLGTESIALPKAICDLGIQVLSARSLAAVCISKH
jgi:hypothetical protein